MNKISEDYLIKTFKRNKYNRSYYVELVFKMNIIKSTHNTQQ